MKIEKIEKIEIKGLFGKKDISWELNPQVNVLVGVNGSGKSTILGIIYSILTDKPILKLFQKAEIYFTGNHLALTRTQIRFDENEEKQHFISMLANYADEFNIPSSKFDELADELADAFVKDLKKKGSTEEFSEMKVIFQDLKKINATMISNLNLSANAIFEFKGSNEEVLNILDLEMDKVLNQFNQKNDGKIQEKLMNALNFFLNTVQKHAEYKNHSIVYFDKDIQKELKFSDLSSGEKQLVYILVQVALNATEKGKSSIILMDEPEISLHLDWQEHFIKQLTILNPDAQFIIVTHSPALIMNGWNDVYVDMEEITTWQ